MRVIFLTMSNMHGIDVKGIYADLMRKFRKEGHELFIVAPRERRLNENTSLYELDGVKVLGVKTLNLQRTNTIEKGVGQILVEKQFKRAIKKYLNGISIDLVIYSTPPITLMGVVKYLRKINPQAMTYLLLKDIFPQNAVDLGLIGKKGLSGLLYRHFRKQEKRIYQLSDHIGCMSPANVQYILTHNPEIEAERLEIAPNSYECQDYEELTDAECVRIRTKYTLPLNLPIFIYGGNLGKPQGVDFLLQCLEANNGRRDCFFLVIGNGTEYGKIESWIERTEPKNISLFESLPKADYDQLVKACDVGLIFLDYRFSIPNYPSRLLPYLMEKKPIIAATDPVSDLGRIAENNGYGYWCESNSVIDFTKCIDKMLASDIKQMGDNGYQFFLKNYTVDDTYNTIVKHCILK